MTKLNQALKQLKQAIANESDFELDAAIGLLEREINSQNELMQKINKIIKTDGQDMTDGECLDAVIEAINDPN